MNQKAQGITEGFNLWRCPGLFEVNTTQTDTTAIATFTITCPANSRYVVRHLVYRNATRASTFSLVYTPNNGTAATIARTTIAGNAAVYMTVIGGLNYGANDSDETKTANPIFLEPGDTLVLTDTTFVAGDDMDYYAVIGRA